MKKAEQREARIRACYRLRSRPTEFSRGKAKQGRYAIRRVSTPHTSAALPPSFSACFPHPPSPCWRPFPHVPLPGATNRPPTILNPTANHTHPSTTTPPKKTPILGHMQNAAGRQAAGPGGITQVIPSSCSISLTPSPGPRARARTPAATAGVCAYVCVCVSACGFLVVCEMHVPCVCAVSVRVCVCAGSVCGDHVGGMWCVRTHSAPTREARDRDGSQTERYEPPLSGIHSLSPSFSLFIAHTHPPFQIPFAS